MKINIGIVYSMSCIYKNKIIHRDLKYDNLLLDKEKNEIKICDFSVQEKIFNFDLNDLSFDVWEIFYAAPEIQTNVEHS